MTSKKKPLKRSGGDVEDLNMMLAFSDIYEMLEGKIDQRKIYLFTDIDPTSMQSVISHIHFMEEKDSKSDIDLYINSDGGYVLDSLALIDVMDASPCDIRTIVVGRAASAACLIASNGTRGKRFAGKNSEFMYHQSMGDLEDVRLSDMKYWTNEMKRIEEKCNKIFQKNTEQDINVIREMFLSDPMDKWMNSKGSKDFGIIDHIITKTNLRTK